MNVYDNMGLRELNDILESSFFSNLFEMELLVNKMEYC